MPKCSLTHPFSNRTVVNTVNVTIDIMTKYAFSPTFIKTDNGSVLVSQAKFEVANILGRNLKQATTNTTQKTES